MIYALYLFETIIYECRGVKISQYPKLFRGQVKTQSNRQPQVIFSSEPINTPANLDSGAFSLGCEYKLLQIVNSKEEELELIEQLKKLKPLSN